MARQNFNEGQEILHADLNTISSRLERGLFDKILYEMTGRKTNAFFQDGFKVMYLDTDSVTVKAGLGFQSYADTDIKEPTKKPVYLAADRVINLTAPHGVNSRIDLICVKSVMANLETELRRYKEEFEDTIYTANFIISKELSAEIIKVDGVADGSLEIPEVPEGYLKIAEVLVPAFFGINSQNDITDTRSLLPFCTYSTFGGVDYDAVIGLEPYCTHETLNDAMADLNAANVKNILVASHPVIDEVQVINQNDVKIEFKRNAILEAGIETALALQIDANGCEVIGGKFSGFDMAIEILPGRKNNIITRCRFVACAGDISDNGDNNEMQINVFEV